MALFTHEFLSIEGDPIRNYYIPDAVGDLPAGTEGDLAYQLDTDVVKAYDGATWFSLVSSAGSGAGVAGRLAIWSGAAALTSDADAAYDTATDRLTLGTGSLTINGKAGQENVLNESGLDQDTRIEGDNVTNVLHVDASLDLLIAGNALQIGSKTKTYGAGDFIAGVTGGHYLQWDQSDGRQTNVIVTNGFSQAPLDLKLENDTPAAYHSLGVRYLLNNSTPAEVEAIFLLGGFSTVTAAGENAVLRILMRDGGVARRNMLDIDLATGATVLNEDGQDHDLRVEGDTNTSLVLVDASLDTVYFGTQGATDSFLSYAPASHLLRIRRNSADAGGHLLDFYKSRSGGAMSADDIVGSIRWVGLNSTPTDIVFAQFYASNQGVTAGAEHGMVRLEAYVNGTNREFVRHSGFSAATVFNELGADLDFRVEGDTEPNLLFLDASTDKVYFRTTLNPVSTDNVSVLGPFSVWASGADSAIRSTSYGGTPSFIGMRAQGTIGGPSQTLNGNQLMRLGSFGWDATLGFVGLGPILDFVATEDYTNTSHGARMDFYTTPNGSLSTAIRARIDQNGNVYFYNTASSIYAQIVENATGETVWNEQGADIDFRVESDNLTHALFVDASLDVVRIGSSAIGGANAFSFEPRAGGATQTDFRMNDTHASSAGVRMMPRKDRAGGVASAGDVIFDLVPLLVNSTPAEVVGARMRWQIDDATASSEDIKTELSNVIAGTERTWLRMNLPGGGGAQGQVWINPDSLDLDFKVSGDTNANLFFVDASVDRIGIGQSGPTAILDIAAATATHSSSRIRAGTAPTSPNEGDLWNDSTQKCLIAYESGVKQSLVGCIFTATADAAISNSVTETTIAGSGVGTKTLPANFLVAGKAVRVTLRGKYTYGTGTLRIRLKLGSTTVLDTAAQTPDSTPLTDDQFVVDCLFTCRTTGAAGTIQANGVFQFVQQGATEDWMAWQMGNTTTTTVDTTASQVLDVTAQWGTADAGNSITGLEMTIEVLN